MMIFIQEGEGKAKVLSHCVFWDSDTELRHMGKGRTNRT